MPSGDTPREEGDKGAAAASRIREKRRAPRRRLHLHSGKIIDPRNNAVLADCQIVDRSSTGARLRLYRQVKLSGRIRLMDEIKKTSETADIVWTRNGEIGSIRPRKAAFRIEF